MEDFSRDQIFVYPVPDMLMIATDAELSIMVRNGSDNQAMAALCQRHKGIILKTAKRYYLHHPSFDDSLSATLLFLGEYCRKIYPNPRYPKSGWLTGLVWHWRAKMGRFARQHGARHIVLPEWWYHGKGRQQRDTSQYAVYVTGGALGKQRGASMDRRIIEGEVRRHVEKLEPLHRRVIVDFYWHDMTYREIGKEINKSGEWVRQLHNQAIAQLRGALPIDLAIALG